MAFDRRPSASPELIEGYKVAASLAGRRRDLVSDWDVKEARIWEQVAEYCRDMASSRAVDDDQFKFQRDKDRYRREVPTADDDLARLRGSFQPPSTTRRLKEWEFALIEMALGHLSPTQRVVFELVEGGRLDINEVAEALQSTSSKIRNQLSRARRKIKEKIPAKVQNLMLKTARAPTRLDTENGY